MMKQMITVGSVSVMAIFAVALAHADDSYTSSTTTQKTTKVAKVCTDENGVSLHKGDAGYKACLKKQGQMGGTMSGTDIGNSTTTNTMNSGDTNVNPDKGAGNTTGTSDAINQGAAGANTGSGS